MYRFLLTPRWWAINVFAALSIPVCLFMGSWQLSRFETRVDTHREQQDRADHAQEEPAAPLRDLLPVTKETSGRLATVTGRFDPRHQMLVPDRTLDGRSGFYVLALLRTDGAGARSGAADAGERPDAGRGAGAAVPVVRGWLPGDADAAADTGKVPALPSGKVTVTGALQSSEHHGSKGVRADGGLPDGQLGVISAASLVNLVPYQVEDAWITSSSAPGALVPVPPAVAEGTGLDLKAFQNLGYTGEWFIFAGFVVFMWFRLFRRETEAARDLALGITPETPSVAAPRPESRPDPGPEDPDDAGRTRSPAGAA